MPASWNPWWYVESGQVGVGSVRTTVLPASTTTFCSQSGRSVATCTVRLSIAATSDRACSTHTVSPRATESIGAVVVSGTAHDVSQPNAPT